MELLKKYIYQQVASQSLSLAEAKTLLRELSGKSPAKEDIAVIGMACRLPGADNVEEYWDNLRDGICSIGQFPESRKKDVEHVWKNPGYMEFLSGNAYEGEGEDDTAKMFELNGYLREWDKFDPEFFGIPPREAKYMDPLQRMFLEVVWESVEDAGYGGENIADTRTGVFVGQLAALPLYRYMIEPDPLLLTGSWEGFLASRISYLFNLRGPAMVVDTACSSALVAIHLASRAIQNNECEMAIAGGVSVSYGALKSHKGPMDMGAVESHDGKVRAFDQNATGTIWGEGFGAVLLKPLRKAIADRDNIHLVLKGCGVNNDGASNGISAPNAEAQEELIHRVWRDNQIDPQSISYIEAHGTGTSLGDPIEIKGLTNVFRRYTDKKQFCGIGSVKTNIGHTVGTAGLASLIKVALAMKHKKLPASINFDYPNQYINFAESPVYVNDSLQDWVSEGEPRRAGISAFGFSGTNAHIVVEEPEVYSRDEKRPYSGPYCIALSAKSEKALMDLVARYADFLRTSDEMRMGDICFTAATGRGHYGYRLAVIVRSQSELTDVCEALIKNGLKNVTLPNSSYGKHRVVSDKRKAFAEGEISQQDVQELSESASMKLGRATLGESPDESLMGEVGRLYVEGANVSWEQMYEGYDVRRISLPRYPFERVRCWADKKDAKAGREAAKVIRHPLLDRCASESPDQDVFVTELNVEQSWLLKDHRVMGSAVLPGTAYLEMAREACSRYFERYPLEFLNVIFHLPLSVKEGERKRVQTILRKMEDRVEFSVMSKEEDGDSPAEWVTHAEGVLRNGDGSQAGPVDMGEIRDKMGRFQVFDAPSVSSEFLHFGERWDNNRKIYANGEEALGTLELREEHRDDLDEFVLHPALLDNAVNIMGYVGGAEEGRRDSDGFLPLSYKKVVLYGQMPARVYSRLTVKPGQSLNADVFSSDLTLFDEKGNVFAEIEDYVIKKVSKKELFSAKKQSMFELLWREADLGGDGAPEGAAHGTALVLRENGSIGEQLGRRLSSSGMRVIEVELGDTFQEGVDGRFVVGEEQRDFDRLVRRIAESNVHQIIYIAPTMDDLNGSRVEELEQQQRKSIYGLFYLVKALISTKVRGNISVTLVSDLANEVTGRERTIKPMNAAFFGLGKVIQAEYPHLACRAIDVDEETGVDRLVQELSTRSFPYQVAYREGRRYTERMEAVAVKKNGPVAFKNGGVYVITGGLGGIGLEIGKHISEQAERVTLALVGRSEVPPAGQWDAILERNEDSKVCQRIRQIRAMESNDASVSVCCADVGDLASTKAMLDGLRTQYGTVNGVIHSAGVAGSGFLINKDEEEFRSVLRSKITGTWVLDTLTREDGLDFFVMFSSVTALMAIGGQGDYCAANCYMDAYSSYRTKVAGRTISINWPAWSETGMALENRVINEGVFKAVSNLEGINSFETILRSPWTRVIPCELNMSVAASILDELPFGVSDEIGRAARRSQAAGRAENQRAGIDFDEGSIAIYGKGEEDYTDVERKMAVIWASVLGLKEIDIYDNYNDLGGDSLLAPQLLKIIDGEFPGMVDITDIFSYPTVFHLSEKIGRKNAGSTVEKEEGADAGENGEQGKIEALLEDLEEGTSSVEDVLDALA